MWGVCIDVNILNGALFQSVVEYIIEDNQAIVISPINNVVFDISKIREIPDSPRFVYGELVSPMNHLDMQGMIHSIKWNFKLKCCYYKIQVSGKVKSKHYLSEDLVGCFG